MALTIIASTPLDGDPPRSLVRAIAGAAAVQDFIVVGDVAVLDLPLLGLFSSIRRKP